MRARGLKLFPKINLGLFIGSRPVRARGLKLIKKVCSNRCKESRPVRARGLKRVGQMGQKQHYIVAPRAGAWIETCRFPLFGAYAAVAPRAGAWIETTQDLEEEAVAGRRAPCGRVD